MVQVQLIIGRRMTTIYYEINYIGNYGAVISMRGVIHLLSDHRQLKENYKGEYMHSIGSSNEGIMLSFNRKFKHYNNSRYVCKTCSGLKDFSDVLPKIINLSSAIPVLVESRGLV